MNDYSELMKKVCDEFIPPQPEKPAAKTKKGDSGWNEEFMLKWLDLVKANFDFFDYSWTKRRDGWMVWCPGNEPGGWPDGEFHGEPYSEINESTIIFIDKGLPCLSCRHAHCTGPVPDPQNHKKKFKDFLDYYDPDRKLVKSIRMEETKEAMEDFDIEEDTNTRQETKEVKQAETPKWEEPPSTPEEEEQIKEAAARMKMDDDFKYMSQDTGNGERLVKKFGDKIRWISETNEWMVWGGNGWRKDNGGNLMRMTKAILKDLVNEAYEDDKPNATKIKHALVSGRLERRKAMISSAGYESQVFTNINDWDADGWLLNCENGVVDLRTQTFRKHKPTDLCMKQSPVRYDPHAKCPLWEAAMSKWTRKADGNDDKSLVEYFQTAWGLALTSDTSTQALFFNQGGGENGKDTAFSAIGHVLGTYCQNVNFMTFVETKYGHSEHRNDLAALAGAVRMVTASETAGNHSLDEGVIKQVTGCSPVTCRQILGKPFTYIPQYKLWFMSNYEAVIKGSDWGIWRRVKKIPWDYTIRAEEKDPNFPEKLRAEGAGILNWALVGLRRYLDLGKKLPFCARVDDATAQYRKDMDIVGRFVDECLIVSSSSSALGQSIYQAYVNWCKANGHFAMNSRMLNGEIKKRYEGKINVRRGMRGVVFEGMGVLVDGSWPDPDMLDKPASGVN